MDTGHPDPRSRDPRAFRHHPLLPWVRKHEGELIAAALTLARAWRRKRSKVGDIPNLGSYEEWARVMGGILKVAGVDGFLGNRREFREEHRGAEGMEIALEQWHKKHGSAELTVADLDDGLKEILRVALYVNPKVKELDIAIGRKLLKQKDLVHGGYKLVEAGREGGSAKGARVWKVLSGQPQLTLVGKVD